MLEAAIPAARQPIDVEVGRRAKGLEPHSVARAIYATGWDGNVVLEARADGAIRVVSPEERSEAPAVEAAAGTARR